MNYASKEQRSAIDTCQTLTDITMRLEKKRKSGCEQTCRHRNVKLATHT